MLIFVLTLLAPFPYMIKDDRMMNICLYHVVGQGGNCEEVEGRAKVISEILLNSGLGNCSWILKQLWFLS